MKRKPTLKSAKKRAWKCTSCKAVLPETAFGKKDHSWSRSVPYRCVACSRERAKKYYHDNRDRCLAAKHRYHLKTRDARLRYMKEYGRKLREETHAAYGGAVCACCGETERAFLTLDHINGGGGKHRRETGLGGYGLYRLLKKQGYPAGYRVLCFNCNSGRALNGGKCPHEAHQV